MNNYIELKKEIISKEINRFETIIKRMKTFHEGELEKYNKYISDIKEHIAFMDSNEYNPPFYQIKDKVHTNNILNTFIHQDLSWFGSYEFDNIDKSVLKISNEFNISVYDSLRILVLSKKIMSLQISGNMQVHMNKIFTEEGDLKKASKYMTQEEVDQKLIDTENKLLFIINKKKISEQEFARLYMKRLETNRTYSEGFGNFLDWLDDSFDYGVSSSFCEEESDGYSRFYEPFFQEKINLEDFR